MTKNEIIIEVLDHQKIVRYRSDFARAMREAMDQWGKQQATAFAQFISGEGWQQYDSHERWICPTVSKEVITTEQLYERFVAFRQQTQSTNH